MRQRTSRYYKILSLLLSLWGLSLVTGTMLFGMGGSLPCIDCRYTLAHEEVAPRDDVLDSAGRKP